MAISPAAGGRRTVGCGGWGRRLAHSSILLRPSVDNAVRYDWRTFVTDTAGHGGKLIVLQRPDLVCRLLLEKKNTVNQIFVAVDDERRSLSVTQFNPYTSISSHQWLTD